MNKKIEDKLFEKFPKIFQDQEKSMQQTCMCWGIETGNGWYDIIERLCIVLQWNTDKNRYPQVIAEQVKEKFGGLRFYYHIEETEKSINNSEIYASRNEGYIEGVIDAYCDMTYKICESCGKPGKANESGWISVLCEECLKKQAQG